MIKLWKFLSVPIVLAVCLGLMLVPGLILADPGLDCGMEIDPSLKNVGFNEAFTVNVTVENPTNQDLCMVFCHINFTPSLLEVTGVDYAGTVGSPFTTTLAAPKWNNTEGWMDYDSGIPEGGTTNLSHIVLATIHMKSLYASGTADLEFVPLAPDMSTETAIADLGANEHLNWTMVVNGTVKVSGAPVLTVNVTPADTGTVTINGTITPTSYPNTTNWTTGDNVTLLAVNSTPGWGFHNWTGDPVPATNPTTITMDSDKDVTANFAELPPELDVDPDSLSLTVAPDATGTTTYTVSNSGGGTLSWNSSNVTYGAGAADWLTQDITSGTLTANVSDTVNVTADATGLAVGTYDATINITGNSSVELPVTLIVGVPAIGFSPTSLTFTTNEGEDPPDQTLEVCNSGSGTLDWSLTDNAGWLSETPTSGSLDEDECEDVTVSVDVSGMAAGDYTATITITGSDEVGVPVTLHIVSAMPVIPVGPAQLSASSLSITPQQVEPGQDVTISVNVANTGGETGSYNAVLYINGVVEDSQSVSVAAGTSKNVIFTVTKSKAGVYDVSVAGQNGQFEVVSTGWFGGGLGTGGIIAIVVIVIVLIVALIFILRGTTRPE